MMRSMLTPLFALLLSVVPACDGEDYADLGVSAEELDRMSAEELDALAESEAQANAEGPELLHNPLPPPTHGHGVPGATDDLGTTPRFTHGLPGATDDLGTTPRFTHAGHNPAAPGALPEFTNGPRPTHDGDLGDVQMAPEEPEGCDTHGDDTTFIAR